MGCKLNIIDYVLEHVLTIHRFAKLLLSRARSWVRVSLDSVYLSSHPDDFQKHAILFSVAVAMLSMTG